MIILHAATRGDKLLVWGEAPTGAARPRAGRRSRTKGPAARRYPYDAGAVILCSALHTAVPGLKPGAKRAEQVVLWLPTRGDVPLASSALIAEPSDARLPQRLAPWRVTGLQLEMDEVIELLCACMRKQALAPGVVVGCDLGCWATALRFAGSVIARERYLPGVMQSQGVYYARWEPVIEGPDARRLAALVQQMPAASRALSDDNGSPPQLAPSAIVNAVVAGMVDRLVRRGTGAEVSAGHEKKKTAHATERFASVHDHWLHALRTADGAMGGDPAALAHFAAQVREWQRPITLATTSPLRLCFRLEDPDEPEHAEKDAADGASGGAWHVRYLLQAADDPSLLIQVADAWRGRRGAEAPWRRSARVSPVLARPGGGNF